MIFNPSPYIPLAWKRRISYVSKKTLQEDLGVSYLWIHSSLSTSSTFYLLKSLACRLRDVPLRHFWNIVHTICNYQAKFSVDREQSGRRWGWWAGVGSRPCRLHAAHSSPWLLLGRCTFDDGRCQIAEAICPQVFITCRIGWRAVSSSEETKLGKGKREDPEARRTREG